MLKTREFERNDIVKKQVKLLLNLCPHNLYFFFVL